MTFNGVDISTLFQEPAAGDDGNICMSGHLDFPARIGKTHHEWPDDEVEPYLSASEIFYGGRDVKIFTRMKAAGRTDAAAKISEILTFMNLQTVDVVSEWGNYSLAMKGNIQIDYIGDGWAHLTYNMREPVVSLTGIIPAATNSSIGIDGISWTNLGIDLIECDGVYNRPESNETQVSVYGREGLGHLQKKLRTYALKFSIRKPTYTQFKAVVTGLYALLSQPGARTLRLGDGTVREFFVKDGFKVTDIWVGSEVTGILTLQVAEIRQLEEWNTLTSGGLALIDKDGKPITEILTQL